jgi:alkylglycerol monooxygenase
LRLTSQRLKTIGFYGAFYKEYLDKNYGQIFIFWDKWFGSFQPERPDIIPVYGITRPAQTWNPIKINFQHLWLLIKDAWRTKSWKDKFRIWMMPTGWRPGDVAEKFPVYKIEDVHHLDKYSPKTSVALTTWSWIQLCIMLLIISYLFGNIARIGSPNIFYYGAFIFLSVYSFTDLMDKSPYAIAWELLRNLYGLAMIIKNNGWFGLGDISPLLNQAIIGYLILSTVVTACFVYTFIRENQLRRHQEAGTGFLR